MTKDERTTPARTEFPFHRRTRDPRRSDRPTPNRVDFCDPSSEPSGPDMAGIGSVEATSHAPPSQKVRDVIKTFVPAKRFKPDDPKTSVTSLDFDDTGELAIVCRNDDTLNVYNCKEGKHAKELKSQKYGVHLARFTHHSQSIIHASTKIDDQIRYLSTHDNSYIRYYKGHTAPVTCITMCPSNDDFMSCSEDNTVRLWNLNTPNSRGMLKLTGANIAAYDPSATVIAVASARTHSILLYDLRNFDKAPFSCFDMIEYDQHYNSSGQGRNWTKLEFSNDGRNLLVGTAGAGHFVLDAYDGSLKHFCARKGSRPDRRYPGEVSPSRAAGQGDVFFTPDGQYIMGGAGADGMVVWDHKSPSTEDKFLRHFVDIPFPNGFNDRVEIATYSPRFNVIGTGDKNFLLWIPDPELQV